MLKVSQGNRAVASKQIFYYRLRRQSTDKNQTLRLYILASIVRLIKQTSGVNVKKMIQFENNIDLTTFFNEYIRSSALRYDE